MLYANVQKKYGGYRGNYLTVFVYFDRMEVTECNTFVTNYVYGYREMNINGRR